MEGEESEKLSNKESLSAAWISYKVFYTKSAVNQTACASTNLPNRHTQDQRMRLVTPDKEFIDIDMIWTGLDR